ncbi:conserved hypothetical protein [Talaromyces stipitatus ATCC 10500]|uniref:Inositol-pentakisphosphate 2-kinase n=1 Tax=Talaromyces stipitatus (strain ATCC 10500 / CBS 375.48 / QM 6759 / NRRL 1006) TaxID=441959 RepID=B8MKS6_TALSN|nr:uncharacterized protein TSTA_043940 [Talaromyces stipitatus ATCC 10500]XP_002484879.1 uncharacterized protein TSTA_043940 [Talaromyces stipitatus ATCC 10500]EED14925.1 conserved hypothetical protein [Talaromyces stipitatus ATCC 10500]EED14926.1 conserved hypothetical protein [Talaromyces stipitatus ATCC 10500]
MASDTTLIPELSPDVRLKYLAEGGANIVYRIILSVAEDKVLQQEIQPSEIPHYGRATPSPTEIEDEDINIDSNVDTDINITSGKLLRLRKNVRYGLPYRETAHDFHTKIRPLFKTEELVDQIIVRIPPSIIHRCNASLVESEQLGQRPIIRHGVYLAEDEPLGMLVTDMTNHSTTNDSGIIVELKPKWLVQSPSAPVNARRCRTCALRDMKCADEPLDLTSSTTPRDVPPGKARFCPLDLTSDKQEDMQRTVRQIFSRSLLPAKIDIVAQALYQHPIILKLLELQRIHNKVGLHGPPFASRETSLSMTLRDCSIFVKIPSSAGQKMDTDIAHNIDIRVGDLDLKSAANGKAEYWLNIERRLIDERWYMGQRESQSVTEKECALSR